MTLNLQQKKLLNNLILDQKKMSNPLYVAGPYWNYKTKKIIYWLQKRGLENFRGMNSGVGSSFTDNVIYDVRNELGFKGRMIGKLMALPIIKKIFNKQLEITSNSIKELIKFKQIYYKNNDKVDSLISNYKIPNSTAFGCLEKFNYNSIEYSFLYLNMCERINEINKILKFDKINSFFELGGGFGSNVHILIENFKNIKKIIYCDIVPNLFIGTEYLKKFYGDSVKDYNQLKNEKKIKFEDNNKLEILCIPPWKIDNIISQVDSFHNSASFQEMTIDQIKNYRNIIKKILNKDNISLIIYDGWENNKTHSPKVINDIFDNKLNIREIHNIENRKLFYLISK